MKQTTVNEFKDGLNLDLHPLVTPKTVLTDNLNGTFITYNGNEFCLQNDRGNKEVAKLSKYYIPIGIKEHNGILYIISHNSNDNTIEIGTYPGLDWNIPEETENDLNYFKYTPLGNFDSRNDFITPYVIIRNWNGEQRENIEEILTRYGVEEYVDELDSILNTDEKAIYFQIDEFYECWQELADLNVFEYVMNIPPNEIRNSNPFRTDLFGFSDKYPVTIEVQDSYDGSVNLILVDGEHKSRMINTGFSVLPNNQYKLVRRKQTKPTNSYSLTNLDQETLLIRTSNVLTNIDLLEVQSGGQFKGGNYTFYIKFGDADYNQTDVVAESGIVSIFNGNDGVPSTISGTLLDERTDKMINLKVTGLNHAYSKLYIYFSREYSDTQGFRMTEYGMLSEPIEMALEGDEQDIWLTGFEQTTPIDSETLNVDYHTVDWARAEAQHSNMLFLGNVGQKETFQLYQELEDFTLKHVTTTVQQSDLVDTEIGDEFSNKNYYSTQNIYYSLGYWPNEWYRFGIVYILDDGSTTPVFNMKGGEFFLNEEEIWICDNSNKKGVFKTPDLDVLSSNQPISFNFTLLNTENLNSKVIGWFVVRQKRIPITICQGINMGIDKRSHLPLVWDGENWVIESFLSLNRSQIEGEPYGRDGNSRRIINVSSLHILRPFIEIFESTTTTFENVKYIVGKSSLVTISANKVLADEYDTWINNSIKSFERMTSSTHVYDENNDVLIKQDGLESNYTKGDKNLHLTVFVITDIKNDNGEYESQTNKFLFYFYYGNLSSQIIENSNIKFYRGNREDVEQNINRNKYDYRFIKEDSSKINSKSSGILSLDPCVNSTISALFDGSKFDIDSTYSLFPERIGNIINYNSPVKLNEENSEHFNEQCVFINENTKSKVLSEDVIFSNLAGSGTSAKQFERTQVVFGVKTGGNGEPDIYMVDDRVNEEYGLEDYKGYNSTHNLNLVRGLFTPYLGVSNLLSDNSVNIYSVKRKYNENEQIVREQDNSEYYCVGRRIYINEPSSLIYRGDCYICKVGLRILRNFVDSTAPIATTIVDPLGWENYVRQRSLYGGDTSDRVNGGNDIDHKAEIADYSEVNLSDLNAVDLGYWVTFPCLSSYNLGLRSLDTFHTDEMALLGSPRSFYPLSGASTVNKVGDSYLLNDGLSATVGRKRYNLMPDVPYSKSEFANRIMFSNVHITDAFTNGYRTFQGLSYKDYDKQYGAITKLISLGQNIFIVMEHGLGLVPVNPKALMQTTTGEAIHIYGYGVLPDEMTIISQDYGSKYEHSVIRTPIGIYGIDVDARKIWRFSDKQGFETISDMKIETYLKDYLESLVIKMGLKDIRTHYNGKKGDIMFTWNDKRGEYLYSICYNERQNLWTTRYDWKPIVSENINDEFYSLNFNAWPDLEDENYCEIWDHADDIGYYGEHVSSWYNDHKWFEFEFVVSDPIGVNKIFDNLQIISNNVQPNEMEITVIGDDYEFKRTPVELNRSRTDKLEVQTDDPFNITTTSNIHGQIPSPNMWIYRFDKRLNQTALTKWQPFKDIYKFGRRIGNIQYKEGTWYAQIEPLLINYKKEARIRDKWAKIRIKYYGEDLAIITAIKTLINI